MRIVFLNRFYKPDHSATSQILTDLAEHLAREGHDVTVLASRMRYDRPEARLPAEEVLAGVRVVRVPTSRFGRGRSVLRAVDYATFYLSAALTLLRLAETGAVVVAKTDPPLASVLAALACRLRGARLVNWCQDLFPEVAAALGHGWAAGPAGRLVAGLRDWSLRSAASNVAINGPMARRLESRGIAPRRVTVIPNWADDGIRPVPRDENRLREEWGLGPGTVVGYSGNLGRAHMADCVVELLRRTRHLDGITWLFIGGGDGLGAVRRYTEQSGRTDIVFRPYQPRELLAESLSVADTHLICLEPRCEGLIMPSKYYGVRDAGRSVLFLGDPNGGVPQAMGEDGVAGAVLDSTKPEGWAAALAGLLGKRGPTAAPRARSGSRASLSAWEALLTAVATQQP